jgi:hypothetical protein
MPFRAAADVLPIDAGKSPATMRSHTLRVSKQLADAAAEKPALSRALNHDEGWVESARRPVGIMPKSSERIVVTLLVAITGVGSGREMWASSSARVSNRPPTPTRGSGSGGSESSIQTGDRAERRGS